jgi:cytochrome c5
MEVAFLEGGAAGARLVTRALGIRQGGRGMLRRLVNMTLILCGASMLVQTATWSGAAAQSGAKPIDPHRVYEQRCNSCHHEHGADLARQTLTLKDGKLRVKRTRQDVSGLLRSHHGVRLSAEESSALLSLFQAGLTWNGVYQLRCGRCHERAVTFARSKLIVRDDQVRTRAGDRDVADLLKAHGKATSKEIEVLITMFKRQLETEEK